MSKHMLFRLSQTEQRVLVRLRLVRCRLRRSSCHAGAIGDLFHSFEVNQRLNLTRHINEAALGGIFRMLCYTFLDIGYGGISPRSTRSCTE